MTQQSSNNQNPTEAQIKEAKLKEDKKIKAEIEKAEKAKADQEAKLAEIEKDKQLKSLNSKVSKEVKEARKSNNASKYKCPNGTAKKWHIEVEKKVYDSTSGDKLSKPYIQILEDNEYKQLMESGKVMGYSYNVVHDPTPYL